MQMRKRFFSSIAVCAMLCMLLAGCAGNSGSVKNVIFDEERAPIDNAIEALKNRDGEMLSHTYFSQELIKYEAEVWSDMTVAEYYSSLDIYLEQVDEYYKATYGEDYVLEYEDGTKVVIEEEDYEEVNEKYLYETKGEKKFNFTYGYVDYGTLSIKGSLGEDSSEVDVMVIYSDKEGWLLYLTDLFFAEFVNNSNQEE